MAYQLRDFQLEANLQTALDSGHNVWVIGDVHGFNLTLRELVEKLELVQGDFVVILGDLIDRGPNSFDVVQFVKNSKNLVSLKGNHEKMMIDLLTTEGLESPDYHLMNWLRVGGLSTVTSYINAFTDDSGVEDSKGLDKIINFDREWMSNLPSQIVLDKWRLVHGGYDPNIPIDEHTDEQLLYIRKPFHDAEKPVDEHRTVLFGHSVTVSLPGLDSKSWGSVWYSRIRLDDGRPSAIGLDTCVYHRFDSPAVLTAYNLQNGEVVQQARVEPWNNAAIAAANEV